MPARPVASAVRTGQTTSSDVTWKSVCPGRAPSSAREGNGPGGTGGTGGNESTMFSMRESGETMSMSASENSERNQFPWTGGPYAVPDHPDLTRVDDPDVDDPDVDEGYEPAALGELSFLPTPFAEKARAAGYVARGAGSELWAAARAHRTVTAGAAAGTAAALALVYGWGRRAGRRAARRDLGPVALLFERRG